MILSEKNIFILEKPLNRILFLGKMNNKELFMISHMKIRNLKLK